jgi:hypothetical protein
MKKILLLLAFVFIIFSSGVYAQRAGSRATSDSVVVVHAGGLISAASNYRMSEVLVNISGGRIFVSFKASPSDSSGFMIAPNGSLHYGAYTLIPWNGAVYARCDSTTATMTRTTVFIQ